VRTAVKSPLRRTEPPAASLLPCAIHPYLALTYQPFDDLKSSRVVDSIRFGSLSGESERVGASTYGVWGNGWNGWLVLVTHAPHTTSLYLCRHRTMPTAFAADLTR